MGEPVAEKPCSTCKKSKPLTDYGVNRTKRDDRQTVCRACKKLYDHARERRYNPGRVARAAAIRAENRQLLWAYLREHPCVDCGETDLVVLDFDHRGEQPKVANVSAMLAKGWGWESIAAEIAKCDVVCANDHRRRTARSQSWAKALAA
jgi:hypothetical protein